MCVVLTYRLSVHTRHMPTAGTSSNVHVMLVGRRGDTGHRRLLRPLSASQTTFSVDSVRLSICFCICIPGLHWCFTMSVHIENGRKMQSSENCCDWSRSAHWLRRAYRLRWPGRVECKVDSVSFRTCVKTCPRIWWSRICFFLCDWLLILGCCSRCLTLIFRPVSRIMTLVDLSQNWCYSSPRCKAAAVP